MKLTLETEETEKLQQEEDSIVNPEAERYDVEMPRTRKEKVLAFMDIFGDLVFLNICFFVASIPIVTMGAAMTALYRVMLKIVRKEEGEAIKSFWKYFARDFVPATKAWVIVIAVLAGIWGEYCYMVTTKGTVLALMIALIGIELVLLCFTVPLVFPLIARYENKTFAYFKNALLLSYQKIGVWFRVFFSWIAPALLTISNPKVLYYGWYAWMFIVVSLVTYSNSMILRKMFDELEQEREK
ncbi:MAG: YesL family protein [Lachnospiraceae bacterium]|nr:YesL family protein [Lachnospiraceae bacterium]